MTDARRVDEPWPAESDVRAPFAVPWSIMHGLGLVAFTLLAPLAVVVGVVLLGVDLDAPLTAAAVSGQALLVTLAGQLAWLARTRRLTWRLLGPARPRPLRDLAVGGLAALPTTVLSLAAVRTVRLLTGQAGLVDPSVTAPGESVEIAAAFIVAGIVAPLPVVLAHHGVLLQALLRRLPAGGAVALSAAVFAVGVPGTVGVEALAGTFVIGACAAALFVRTRSVTVVLTMVGVAAIVERTARILGG